MRVDFISQNNKGVVICPIMSWSVKDYRWCKVCRFNKKIAKTYIECDYPFFAKEEIDLEEVKKVMSEIEKDGLDK